MPQNLPDYENRLLGALAFFLGRDVDAQARACLCMYLRQSEPRIMAQVKYYAHRLSAAWGREVSEYELLELIAGQPEKVTQALPNLAGVHRPDEVDVFTDTSGSEGSSLQ
jgi:hypothetical protein